MASAVIGQVLQELAVTRDVTTIRSCPLTVQVPAAMTLPGTVERACDICSAAVWYWLLDPRGDAERIFCSFCTAIYDAMCELIDGVAPWRG